MNPFDQFDEGNPFNQFSDAKKPSPAEKRADLARGATLKIGPLDTGVELPQWLTEALAGAGQRMTDIATLGTRDTESTKSADAALSDSGFATAGKIGTDIAALLAAGGTLSGISRLAGATSPAGVRAVDLLGKAGRAMIAPRTVTGAAAVGAGYGAATTSGGLDERLHAGMVGGAGGALLPGVVKAAKVGKAIIDPMTDAGKERLLGNLLNRAAGSQADDAALKMATAGEIVAGSAPTVAQVAESPGLAALERGLGAVAPGGAYGQRMIDQNAARLAVASNLAGDSGERAFMEAARETAANDLYKLAFEKGISPAALTPSLKGQVTQLLQRPAMQQAMKEARTLALNAGEKLSDRTSLKGLHYAKMALDDQIDAANRAGNGQMVRALISTRDKLLGVMDNLSDDYAQARVTYAEMSKPINQMEIGQRLLDALEPAVQNRDLPARVNAASFSKAVRDADATAKKATGFSGAKMERVMTPEQLSEIDSIRRDLARSAYAADAGRGVGSNTAQNLSMQNLAESIGFNGLPNLLSRPVQLAEYFLRGIYRRADDEMREQAAMMMLDPKRAAALMQSASRAQQPNMLELAAQRGALPMNVLSRELAAD